MKKKTILSKKILRSIEDYWNDPDSQLDLKKLLENRFQYFEMEDCYGYSIDGSVSGKLRKKTISILIDIYMDWKSRLDEQNLDYYLAIWLYIPRMSKSQVVCAIDDKITYYDNDVFLPAKEIKKFPQLNFGKIPDASNQFTWELKVDLDNLYEWEVNFPKQNWERLDDYRRDQKRFKKNIESSIRKIDNDGNVMYLFPVGDVWVGKINPKLTIKK
ncbi:hypothetical protein [Dyadobacter psychrotolerans]|uniref:Uncharacterized protein n=1 Tax=Dyadobacter psychrotolerans TaxID=2541721 RepID=A0A4R5D8J5_9BACT|nr:hypothetical protein [Dyadobacter psychrotolerans]TDE09037.1 hypothetical protein E0F88_31640 [Dyadobacter psychrotolerans]